MKPPPPPIVSIRYFGPGTRVLMLHLIPADAVISTNWIGEGLGTCAADPGEPNSPRQTAVRQRGRMTFIKANRVSTAFVVGYLLPGATCMLTRFFHSAGVVDRS